MLYPLQAEPNPDDPEDTECACGEEIPMGRVLLGYETCLKCGDKQARKVKHLIAIPYSKGAYQYIHNPKDLFQTNPKEVRT